MLFYSWTQTSKHRQNCKKTDLLNNANCEKQPTTPKQI